MRSRTYVAGAPRDLRDRIGSAKRALRRRERAGQVAMARMVAARTDRQLENAPVGPIFCWVLPFALRAQFRREVAVDHDGNDIDALILLNIERSEGPRRDQFEIVLSHRRCRVRRYRGGRAPDGTLTATLADMIRMAANAAETAVLISDGRVVVAGDAFLVYRFPAMFRQPTRPVI